MTRFTMRRGRALSAIVGVVALAGLTFGVTQAFAGQGHKTAPIRNHRDECSSDSKNRVVGTATFTQKAGSIKVKVSINNGEPGDYDLLLYYWTGSTCDQVGGDVKFKVDGSGNGSATVSADVTGYGQWFFADAYNDTTGYDNESDWVRV